VVSHNLSCALTGYQAETLQKSRPATENLMSIFAGGNFFEKKNKKKLTAAGGYFTFCKTQNAL